MDLVLEEIRAPHDEDFREHLGMLRSHSFRGKDPGSFVHRYEKGSKKKDPEVADKFHGIMEYHGYSKEKQKKPDEESYSRGDEGREHRVTAYFDENGGISSIHHQERFKGVNEDRIDELTGKGKLGRIMNYHGAEAHNRAKAYERGDHERGHDEASLRHAEKKARAKRLIAKRDGVNESELKIKGGSPSNSKVRGNAPFGKKLRDIVPRKEKVNFDADHANPNSDGDWQKTNSMDRIASMHNIVKWPLHIGDGVDEEPFKVATVSGKDGRKLHPDVGFKDAPEHVKKMKGINEGKSAYSEEEEKDRQWNARQEKVHSKLHSHWLKTPGAKWTPHLMKNNASGLVHSLVQHDDGSYGSGEDHLKSLQKKD